MDGISISNWIAIAGLAAGVLTPFGLSWLTVWYHTKRTNEILRDHQRKDKEHDAKLHTLELNQVRLTAEVEGLAGKIFTKLDALQDAMSTLTQRLNNVSKS